MTKPAYITPEGLRKAIQHWLDEDTGDGDHSTLSVIPEDQTHTAILIVKEKCVLAGVAFAEEVMRTLDPNATFEWYHQDGDYISEKKIAGRITAKSRALLSGERLLLNAMQRMSGIATRTREWNARLVGTKARLLDTRKTTPGFRMLEKWAVKIGGGENHRFGLFDMVMLKDNHIDCAGGILPAVEKCRQYLKAQNLDLKIEVETRNLTEVKEAEEAGADRIMLDNMSVSDMHTAVELIAGRCETEASGGVTRERLQSIAATGVDYISAGALIHSAPNIDISLKTEKA